MTLKFDSKILITWYKTAVMGMVMSLCEPFNGWLNPQCNKFLYCKLSELKKKKKGAYKVFAEGERMGRISKVGR